MQDHQTQYDTHMLWQLMLLHCALKRHFCPGRRCQNHSVSHCIEATVFRKNLLQNPKTLLLPTGLDIQTKGSPVSQGILQRMASKRKQKRTKRKQKKTKQKQKEKRRHVESGQVPDDHAKPAEAEHRESLDDWLTRSRADFEKEVGPQIKALKKHFSDLQKELDNTNTEVRASLRATMESQKELGIRLIALQESTDILKLEYDELMRGPLGRLARLISLGDGPRLLQQKA
ncbi:hypothetical protein DFS34DRAFT_110884 [Phlyctochytrium arcticum]|nr:hypothetical protein DFS34DRAFT_110884 [Phlyctochytrium arcticum]